MGLLLLVSGGFFGLIFILGTVIQTARRNERLGFTVTLLAFLTNFVVLAALIVNSLSDSPQTIVPGVIVIAASTLVVGLVVFAAEIRRPQRNLVQSRGILSIGVGLLLLISTFTVPFMSSYFDVPDEPLPNAASSPTWSVTPLFETITPFTETPTVPPTETRTPTSTRTPRPSPTPTTTRQSFATRTPTRTPTLPNPCLAVVDYNLNLRAQPDPNGEVLLVIPYNSNITLFARNTDSTWWLTQYEDQVGWVSGEFIRVSDSCGSLPIQN